MKYALSIMFGVVRHGVIDSVEKTIVINYLPFIVIGLIACLPISRLVKKALDKFSEKGSAARVCTDFATAVFVAFNLFISTAAVIGSSYNPFLYFRF